MDTITKFKHIATQMYLEPSEEVGMTGGKPDCFVPLDQVAVTTKNTAKSFGIHNAKMPGGKTIPLMKTMMTTACERNCFYCPFRAGRTYKRETIKPDDMAANFMKLHKAKIANGLFLSSGIIKGGVTTQDKIIATAEILRKKYGFRGYLHLKVMPGAEKAQIERMMQVADRLSINLEGANEKRLPTLAPKKEFVEELLRPLLWIEQIRQEQPRLRRVSATTQFVVGPAGESDLELLSTVRYLNQKGKLARAYFSAFFPIRDTPFENELAENPQREHRLYQSSFLLRDYGFDLEELPFVGKGNLPLDKDPKLAWADMHLRQKPLELNRADRRQLLRIPGVGPKSADTILSARRLGTIRSFYDLKKLGLRGTSRMQSYVLLDGKQPAQQLRLF